MPDPTAKLDYPFLLLTHMACADQHLHYKELKVLYELASHKKKGERTIKEMKKILAYDEQCLSVEEVARNVLLGQRGEVMRQILEMAYVDGFFAPLEREMVKFVAGIWNWSSVEIQQCLDEAESFTANRYINKDDAQLEQSIDVPLPASKNVKHNLEEPPREILLEGTEYEAAIRRCAVIAVEDYQFAKIALEGTESALTNLEQNIEEAIDKIKRKAGSKGQATTAKEVAQQLENTKKTLTTEIMKEIESVHESLNAKQRALNHFSIAFMGKTKAGKSTLHAIMTGQGWDAIGVGQQRTTRSNRVYEWNNIRIIDTPGIGAPGGQTDEEIAESIIEESDVICYVVTNDSIQETEFGFLRVLKEKGKPLMVLLNVKNNLRDSRRLDYFLKDPNKLFAMEGKSGLGGHIERIRRYAKEHYANDYFDIIPVLLLAAQMSHEPEHNERKDKLFQASRIQDFSDSIYKSLVEYGPIRRSQTLLGSTVGEIENPRKQLTKQVQAYQELTDTLKNKHKSIRKQIEAVAKDNGEALQHKIKAIFLDASNTIPSFAEEHWNSNENTLKSEWWQKLKSIHFEERLRTAHQETSQNFNKDMQKILEEVGNELQLIAKLGGFYFSFQEQDSSNFRDLFQIGGSLMLIASSVVFLFAAPVGIALGIAASAFSLITGLFKSKDEKWREAVQKISSSLVEQMKKQENNTLQQAESSFKNLSNEVKINIQAYFDELITGLETISGELQEAESELSKKANDLNRAYAKRVIDWCTEQYEPLTEENINKAIANVERDFGQSMNIKTRSKFSIQKNQKEIQQVLQEDVKIQTL